MEFSASTTLMKPIKLILISTLALGFILLSELHAAPPAYNLQATLANEDIGGSDTFYQLTGSVKYGKGLTRKSAINLNADIYTRSNKDLNDNDRYGLLGEVFYSYAPTVGYSKPVYLVGLRQELEYFDKSIKDTSVATIFAAGTYRPSDQMSVTAGMEIQDIQADIGDTDSTGLFLNLDFRLDDQAVIYSNFKFKSEDGVGSYLTNYSTWSNTAWWYADSDITSITVGVNYFIDSKHTIDISYERVDYDSTVDITRNLISFDYFYKF